MGNNYFYDWKAAFSSKRLKKSKFILLPPFFYLSVWMLRIDR
jgi:hypothetical protein